MYTLIFAWTFIIMLIMSLFDIIEQKIPLLLIILEFLSAIICKVFMVQKSMQSVALICLGIFLDILPGILMAAMAIATDKIGIADGLCITFIGIIYGFRIVLFMLCISLFMISFISIVMRALKRVHKNTTLPYLPFLTAALAINNFLTR